MHSRLSQWWNEISIRTKITGITVCLVTLGLLVAGLGTMTVLSTYLYGQVDRDLKTGAASIQWDGADSCTSNFGNYKTSYVAIFSNDGELLCDNGASLPASSTPYLPDFTEQSAATHPTAFSTYNALGTEEWRLYADHTTLTNKSTSQSVEATVVAGTNLATTNATITRFSYIFLGFGLSVVVLGAAITRLLVTSTFAPLRDVEDTAARFADGDFSQRLDTTTPNTEVGRLNRSLNTMLSRIDYAFDDRAKTIDQMRRFVGDASHELRTPLVSLRGYAELYRMGALTKPEDVAQAMDRIEKEAIRMGVLVQDLLQLARLDESKPLELGPVDLVTIARDSALDTMASNTDREIRVFVREPVDPGHESSDEYVVAPGPVAPLAPGTTGPIAFAGATLARLRIRRARAAEAGTDALDAPSADGSGDGVVSPVILGEENKIRQVVTNLMGNAMRFTDHDAPIELAVQADPGRGMATIDIIDHGEGIPPQIREKIFQRFWRADTSRTRDTGGSGLGLAIVSGIVAAHHGDVDVFDTPGGGATFRVSLPLMPAGPVPTLS
ncbi:MULTISPECIES: cell wall metabolism sensor histidine kinase WalK [unclassified Frondihabitans]|uniref:sensor histidine kinase n=1 Tax=unclassified Frondihabitans TaxID=2626248 RepID=UPI000F4D9454|nr:MULTISPECIES: HAMP domain-containing sensor histidine kinase [unclassified Frondihabitans]RPE75990.1 two-component system OmpR family sensor kinase [Frondihabitans sp. PhB153]RPF05733.1 two-component system OmpR family sensor kinase [Frondihabitans sp. PhB161]